MNFQELIHDLPSKRGAVYTLEKSKAAARSFASLHDEVMAARAQLCGWGVRKGLRVGIYARNCYHWLVYDLAIIDIGAISVAFTDDFDGKLDDEVLAKYGVSLLLISKASARDFPDPAPHIAFLDAPTPDARILERPVEYCGDEDDQLSLVFSSGSAGGLKGLVISRKGVCSTLPPIMEALGTQVHDRMLLFLPMSNFQQRFLCYAALWYDFEIIITDFADLFSAMRKLHPTILLAPPVFYQMVHGEFARRPALTRWSLTSLGKLLSFLPFAPLRRRLARLLFRDFYRQFGSRIRLLITGMAPIRPNIAEFFSAAQLPLSEAYGMVEASVMAFRPPGSKYRGSVGKPLRGVQFTIAKDNELIVSRDHPLTLRYFQCAEGENERTFLGPGRIATGDIGRFGRSGELFILGRKGEVIVTANGHKLHPEVIENELNSCADVANSVIFRRPDAAHLTCVVSLHDSEDALARQRVRKFVAGLRSTKKASQFVEVIFAEAAFSRENGMLRPNMKIDRKNIVSRYRNAPLETGVSGSS